MARYFRGNRGPQAWSPPAGVHMMDPNAWNGPLYQHAPSQQPVPQYTPPEGGFSRQAFAGPARSGTGMQYPGSFDNSGKPGGPKPPIGPAFGSSPSTPAYGAPPRETNNYATPTGAPYRPMEGAKPAAMAFGRPQFINGVGVRGGAVSAGPARAPSPSTFDNTGKPGKTLATEQNPLAQSYGLNALQPTGMNAIGQPYDPAQLQQAQAYEQQNTDAGITGPYQGHNAQDTPDANYAGGYQAAYLPSANYMPQYGTQPTYGTFDAWRNATLGGDPWSASDDGSQPTAQAYSAAAPVKPTGMNTSTGNYSPSGVGVRGTPMQTQQNPLAQAYNQMGYFSVPSQPASVPFASAYSASGIPGAPEDVPTGSDDGYGIPGAPTDVPTEPGQLPAGMQNGTMYGGPQQGVGGPPGGIPGAPTDWWNSMGNDNYVPPDVGGTGTVPNGPGSGNHGSTTPYSQIPHNPPYYNQPDPFQNAFNTGGYDQNYSGNGSMFTGGMFNPWQQNSITGQAEALAGMQGQIGAAEAGARGNIGAAEAGARGNIGAAHESSLATQYAADQQRLAALGVAGTNKEAALGTHQIDADAAARVQELVNQGIITQAEANKIIAETQARAPNKLADLAARKWSDVNPLLQQLVAQQQQNQQPSAAAFGPIPPVPPAAPLLDPQKVERMNTQSQDFLARKLRTNINSLRDQAPGSQTDPGSLDLVLGNERPLEIDEARAVNDAQIQNEMNALDFNAKTQLPYSALALENYKTQRQLALDQQRNEILGRNTNPLWQLLGQFA